MSMSKEVQSDAIKLNHTDNVAVVLNNITKGTEIFGIISAEAVPAGHKIALGLINKGNDIIKYGKSIGKATSSILPGQHVHVHNIKTNLSGIESYEYMPVFPQITIPVNLPDTFMGYRRKDGKVGIRNEIWIINTVGCVNRIAERVSREANRAINNDIIDGVYTFVHPYGCSQLGEDHIFTQQILKNLVEHPNAAGVLVLGLGCENNLISEFQKLLSTKDDEKVKFLNAQDCEDEVEDCLKIINQLVKYASLNKREPIPVNELIVGLKCGASDGLSGITANALTGDLSDAIIAKGGSCVLTEVPEMFGAETLLMNRCKDEAVFNKTVSLINDFKEYFISHNQEIYENPSPGNKEGGITTLEEKSLGCIQKGGESKVVDVLNYGETVKHAGLNLLKGPGNDIVAVTNLAAAGAHMVLFTTGRGTPLGGPVPTVKISSNTALAEYKKNWIDFDAGILVNGADREELTSEFYNYIIKVASGSLTKNEVHDYREIAIFKDGVTL